MRLTSTYTHETANDIPVLIVCHENRKVFMLKTPTYSELISNIRKKFGIGEPCGVSLETVSLDVCRGSRVEIDENAWPVMRGSVDEVVVVVTHGCDLLRVNNVDVDVPMPVDADVQAQEYLAPAVAEDGLSYAGESYDDARSIEERLMKVEPEGDDEVREENMVAQEAKEAEQPLSVPVPVDEIPQPIKRRKPSSKRIFARFDDDDDAQTHEPPPRPVASPLHEEEQEQEGEEFVDFANQPEPPKPKAKRVPSPEERFQVRVEGPEPDQHAEIKTRGKHLVKKVLGAVCKTFGIDVDSAVLYIITNHIDDEGEHEERAFKCPLDWTMAKCDVTSKTNLRIQIETDAGEVLIPVTQRSK